MANLKLLVQKLGAGIDDKWDVIFTEIEDRHVAAS